VNTVPKPEVIPLKLRPSDCQEVIRRLARESGKVLFSMHAEDRMMERGITVPEVLSVLREGIIRGEVNSGKTLGEWKCKIVGTKKGSREIGVVTLVRRQEKLFIVTVEWEDL
jgi:hypothetical protein